MFGWIKEKTTFAKLAGKWYDATSMNPGDNGQISVFASGLVKRASMSAEDAWLSALVNWTCNCPYPEFKFLLARGILDFVDACQYEIDFSPGAISAAKVVANSIYEAGPLV